MKELNSKHFVKIALKVIKDFGVYPDDNEKEKEFKNKLADVTNTIFAYHMWSNENHMFSSFTREAESSKNINTYIKSQIKHIEKTMELCIFQYSNLSSYFHLYGLYVLFLYFISNKAELIKKLHTVKFRSLTEPEYFDKRYLIVKEEFGDLFRIEKKLKVLGVSSKVYNEEDFADSIIKMYKFFDAFNITEKRLKINFSINLYKAILNLSLSKNKIKEITDTILYHLDIDATINLKKIDKIYYIGSIGFHHIYGYDKPLIPTIQFFQKDILNILYAKKKELKKKNEKQLLENIEIMIKRVESSFIL